jgi:hypothetical protein
MIPAGLKVDHVVSSASAFSNDGRLLELKAVRWCPPPQARVLVRTCNNRLLGSAGGLPICTSDTLKALEAVAGELGVDLQTTAKIERRGRGRPATGHRVAFRLPKDDIARIDQWAEGNGYSRSEALRVLIKRALEV